MVVDWNYCGDHHTKYTNIAALLCTPETNIMSITRQLKTILTALPTRPLPVLGLVLRCPQPDVFIQELRSKSQFSLPKQKITVLPGGDMTPHPTTAPRKSFFGPSGAAGKQVSLS